MLLRGHRRQWPIVVALLLTGLSIFYLSSRQTATHASLDGGLAAATELSDVEAQALCKQQHASVADGRRARRVYDLVSINTELDLLEIRLNELAPYVDYFVIVESTHTFTGQTKGLHLRNHLGSPRFRPFSSKIIRQTFGSDLTPPIDPWLLERRQRNSLLSALQNLPPGHPAAPKENDVLMVSDIDEIPRPSALTLLKTCSFPTDRITLSTTSNLYSFSTIHSIPSKRHWLHPQATTFRYDETIRPEDLRTSAHEPDLKAQYRVIGDAGWHCSSCFSTIAEFQDKIRGFSHQEFNHPVFLDPAQIVRRVKDGIDLAERKWEAFVKSKAEVDLPLYLERNKDRFPWLVDRDAENARFLDWEGAGAKTLDEWEGEWPEKWPE